MKNTKNPMKNKNVVPEFVVVYTVDGGGNRGQGDTRQDYTMLVTRKQLDVMIAERGTAWVKKLYKLGNEVKFLAPEYVED
jgi:hypothetical protein